MIGNGRRVNDGNGAMTMVDNGQWMTMVKMVMVDVSMMALVKMVKMKTKLNNHCFSPGTQVAQLLHLQKERLGFETTKIKGKFKNKLTSLVDTGCFFTGTPLKS